MKYVLSLLLFFSVSASAEGNLREHMTAMGYILDSIWVLANDAQTYPQAADKTAELRGHLTQAIALTPSSIEALQPKQKRAALIEYHQLMARTIHLSASLEQAFSAVGQGDLVSGNRQQDIQNLLREVSVVVGRGHGRFRK